MKLTKLQLSTLQDYASVFDEGYAYPSELGVPLKTVKFLVGLEFLKRDGNVDGNNVDYRITEKGNKFLIDFEAAKYFT